MTLCRSFPENQRSEIWKVATGDAEYAKRILKRILCVKNPVTLMVEEERNRPLRLKMIDIRVYGTCNQELLDKGEMPNLTSDNLEDEMSITPEDTNRKITLEYGNNATILGMIS